MSQIERWDERYREGRVADRPPSPVLVEAAALLMPGDALDLACGLGRHALYLASQGWRVVAVDAVARVIEPLAAIPGIAAITADLEAAEFRFEAEGYHLICLVQYLQWNLLPKIRMALRPGGLLALEAALEDPRPGIRAMNPAFLSRPGRWREEFADWEIVLYEETEPENSRAVVRMIARKPPATS